MLYDITIEKAFSVNFNIDKVNCSLTQIKDKFEFSLENIVYSHIMEVEKNKSKMEICDNLKPSSLNHKTDVNVRRKTSSGSFLNTEIVKTPNENNSPIFNFSIKSSSQSQSQTQSLPSSVSNSPLVPRKFDFNDIKVSHSPKTPLNVFETTRNSSNKDFVSSDDLFSLDNSESKDLIDFTKQDTNKTINLKR